tara:strand:- start:440 stop:655 length:216 start_codon:yes stop_codon:yes gene_type:complete
LQIYKGFLYFCFLCRKNLFNYSNKESEADRPYKGTGLSTKIVILIKNKKVAWCGYKYSIKGAFCDSSQRNL